MSFNVKVILISLSAAALVMIIGEIALYFYSRRDDGKRNSINALLAASKGERKVVCGPVMLKDALEDSQSEILIVSSQDSLEEPSLGASQKENQTLSVSSRDSLEESGFGASQKENNSEKSNSQETASPSSPLGSANESGFGTGRFGVKPEWRPQSISRIAKETDIPGLKPRLQSHPFVIAEDANRNQDNSPSNFFGFYDSQIEEDGHDSPTFHSSVSSSGGNKPDQGKSKIIKETPNLNLIGYSSQAFQTPYQSWAGNNQGDSFNSELGNGDDNGLSSYSPAQLEEIVLKPEEKKSPLVSLANDGAPSPAQLEETVPRQLNRKRKANPLIKETDDQEIKKLKANSSMDDQQPIRSKTASESSLSSQSSQLPSVKEPETDNTSEAPDEAQIAKKQWSWWDWRTWWSLLNPWNWWNRWN